MRRETTYVPKDKELTIKPNCNDSLNTAREWVQSDFTMEHEAPMINHVHREHIRLKNICMLHEIDEANDCVECNFRSSFVTAMKHHTYRKYVRPRTHCYKCEYVVHEN